MRQHQTSHGKRSGPACAPAILPRLGHIPGGKQNGVDGPDPVPSTLWQQSGGASLEAWAETRGHEGPHGQQGRTSAISCAATYSLNPSSASCPARMRRRRRQPVRHGVLFCGATCRNVTPL
jgi:hypothetical protein